MKKPVSVVIPTYNAHKYIKKVIEALFDQDYPGTIELIVVNDGSTDDSLEIVENLQKKWGFKVINQPHQGAVAATNNGLMTARHDIICSVDSDVVLHRDWLGKIAEEFDDPAVGAVQGYYKTPKGISFLARMMGYDIEARYDSIKSKDVTQVCTGNTAYSRSALEKVGFFDPSFTYGYDNDMSYRLKKSGFRVVFRKDALCDHYWKTDIRGYILQQYRSAYGRMHLIKKHKGRITGDSVSGLRMILQVPLTFLFPLSLLAGFGLKFFSMDSEGRYFLLLASSVIGILLIDRLSFAIGIFRKQKDSTAFLLPFVHLLRNVVWCGAFLKWGLTSISHHSS